MHWGLLLQAHKSPFILEANYPPFCNIVVHWWKVENGWNPTFQTLNIHSKE